MDFELPLTLRESVVKAVFGGPPPDTQVLQQVMLANKLDWPLSVVATCQWRPSDKAASAGIRVLQLHAGLTYLLSNRARLWLDRKLASIKIMHGSIESADSPAHLFHAIQQSILSLRRQELHLLDQQETAPGLRQRARPGRPSWESELDLQRLLTDQILHHNHHWAATAEVWIQLVLHRHPDHLSEVRRKIAQLVGGLGGMVDQNPTFSYTFSNAIEQLYRTYAYSDFPQMVKGILADMQLHLPGRQITQQHQSATMIIAMVYIREKFHMPISLRDVASHAGVSSSHLARQFKSGTGQSVSQWLHRLRVIRARQLLIETDATVLEIALDCGFGAVEHFHRVFKSLAGLTPHRFRQMHQHAGQDQKKS